MTFSPNQGLEPQYELPDFVVPDQDLVFKTKVFGEIVPVDPWVLCANTPDMQHIRYLHGIEINGDNPHDAEWSDHSWSRWPNSRSVWCWMI